MITSDVTRVTHVDRLEDIGTSGDLEGFAGSRRVRLDSQRFELAVKEQSNRLQISSGSLRLRMRGGSGDDDSVKGRQRAK